MAALDDFKPEPGFSRCGSSYNKELTVSGEIPNGYGKDRTHLLTVVASRPVGDWWGRVTAAEESFSGDISEALDSFVSDLGEAERLIPAEVNALESMERRARDNIRTVGQIYDYWDGKTPGLPKDFGSGMRSEWPLSKSDILGEHMPVCFEGRGTEERVTGTWQDVTGLTLGGVEKVRRYFCHPPSVIERRNSDRLRIRDLLEEAARMARCAGWTLWRTELYRESAAEFAEIDAGDFALPTAGAPAPVGGLGFTPGLAEPDWPTPPNSPVDAVIQTVDPLPPGPESIPIPEPLPDGAVQGVSTQKLLLGAAAVGLIGYLAFG